MYLKVVVNEREGERQKNLSAGSLPEWQKQPQQGQAEARSLGTDSTETAHVGVVETVLGTSASLFPGTLALSSI